MQLFWRWQFPLLILLGAVAGCGNDPPAKAVPSGGAEPRQVRVIAAAETEAARMVSASGFALPHKPNP